MNITGWFKAQLAVGAHTIIYPDNNLFKSIGDASEDNNAITWSTSENRGYRIISFDASKAWTGEIIFYVK